MINKFTRILIAVAWFLLVWQLVTMPMPVYPDAIGKITYADKLVHFMLFGLLFYFWFEALLVERKYLGEKNQDAKTKLKKSSRKNEGGLTRASQGLDKRNLVGALLPSFLFSTAFSFITEYLQLYIPGRTSSWYDTAAGMAGILFFAWYAWKRIRPGKPKLLLHICCVGCGAYIARELSKDFKVTLFFSNSNIFPEDEEIKRLDEAKKISKELKLKLAIDQYDHQAWLEAARGLEKEKERGRRCPVCYRFRMERTARLARKKGFDFFTTTLSISPHKDAKAILAIGADLESAEGVKFLARDFKKQDGYKKSCAFSHELNLYRQNYCGCEFSIR